MQRKTYNSLEKRKLRKIAVLSQQEFDDTDQRGTHSSNMGTYEILKNASCYLFIDIAPRWGAGVAHTVFYRHITPLG